MYFHQKYKGLGWRRRKTILQPIINSLTFGIKNRLLNKLLMYGFFAPIEKIINNYLTRQYARQWLNQSSSLSDDSLSQVSTTVINQN
jgi:hypothetical protein